VYVTLADQPTARHVLAEIDDVLAHRPDLGVLVDEVSGLRGLLGTHVRDTVGGTTPHPGRAPPPPVPADAPRLPGERLFLSRNTAATQVGSIYRKLGVSSRSAAVERATTVGLLGG
jgi:LuxR family maltose regulon positive regulatory protein